MTEAKIRELIREMLDERESQIADSLEHRGRGERDDDIACESFAEATLHWVNRIRDLAGL